MEPIKVEMMLEKETKRTYRFRNDEVNTPITTLYISKGAFDGGAPERIIVDVLEHI